MLVTRAELMTGCLISRRRIPERPSSLQPVPGCKGLFKGRRRRLRPLGRLMLQPIEPVAIGDLLALILFLRRRPKGRTPLPAPGADDRTLAAATRRILQGRLDADRR